MGIGLEIDLIIVHLVKQIIKVDFFPSLDPFGGVSYKVTSANKTEIIRVLKNDRVNCLVL